jgi:large subunit ribosomal protein L30
MQPRLPADVEFPFRSYLTKMNAKKKVEQIKVTQIKGLIGQKEKLKRTVEALGLKRIDHSVIHEDNDVIRGMVFKVKHLVTVEKV